MVEQKVQKKVDKNMGGLKCAEEKKDPIVDEKRGIYFSR